MHLNRKLVTLHFWHQPVWDNHNDINSLATEFINNLQSICCFLSNFGLIAITKRCF